MRQQQFYFVRDTKGRTREFACDVLDGLDLLKHGGGTSSRDGWTLWRARAVQGAVQQDLLATVKSPRR